MSLLKRLLSRKLSGEQEPEKTAFFDLFTRLDIETAKEKLYRSPQLRPYYNGLPSALVFLHTSGASVLCQKGRQQDTTITVAGLGSQTWKTYQDLQEILPLDYPRHQRINLEFHDKAQKDKE